MAPRWVLYCSVCGHPPDRPLPSSGFGYHDGSSQVSHHGHYVQHQDGNISQGTGSQPLVQLGFNEQGNIATRTQAEGSTHDTTTGSGSLSHGLNVPVEVGIGFEQVLEGLNGSKASALSRSLQIPQKFISTHPSTHPCLSPVCFVSNTHG